LSTSREAPAEVEVEVREGMITPSRSSWTRANSSYVRVVDDRARAGFRTAGRNQVTDYSQQSAGGIPHRPAAKVLYAQGNAAYWNDRVSLGAAKP